MSGAESQIVVLSKDNIEESVGRLSQAINPATNTVTRSWWRVLPEGDTTSTSRGVIILYQGPEVQGSQHEEILTKLGIIFDTPAGRRRLPDAGKLTVGSYGELILDGVSGNYPLTLKREEAIKQRKITVKMFEALLRDTRKKYRLVLYYDQYDNKISP
jgi:hypothetical protein